MKRLAIIPSDSLSDFLKSGYSENWLRKYFNPGDFFDEIFVFSPLEKDGHNILGMRTYCVLPHQLPRKLKEFNINIVRAYGGFTPCDMACLNKVGGIPVIVSVHDMRDHLLYDSIKLADFVFSTSESVHKLVLSKFPYPSRVWILPNRIHFDVMRPRISSEYEYLNHEYSFKYKVLHIARKDKVKNLDNLIKAMSLLDDDYALLAIGSGDSSEYQELAKNLNVSHRCFLKDAVPMEKLPNFLSWADCLCNPSLSEAFGMAVVESLACGAVVVVSDIPVMREIIQHEENGLLVKDYRNPVAIAHMIKQACTNNVLRTKLKRNARKSVERFEQSRIDELEKGYYQKIFDISAQGNLRVSLKEYIQAKFRNLIRIILPISFRKALLSIIRK